jgi:phospholipase/lecithinase/hemolysin
MANRGLSTRPRWIVSLVFGTMFVLCGGARGDGITSIVSFGDSLSDVGNVYTYTKGAQPAPANECYGGRFTNGGNWLDYLAKDLGVAAPVASALGGADYAFGGASTGPGYTTTSSGQQVPNVDTQISGYLAGNTPAAGQLFTIWAGGNDLLINGQTNPLIPAQNIANEVTTLALAGAKQFLIPNLPSLGEIPAVNQIPAQQAAANAWSAGFDAALQADLAPLQKALGIQIHTLNIQGLLQNIIANPSQFGFTNVTGQAINPSLNGNGYLFWDQEHPTTAADSIIGEAASQAVPEPSMLLVFGSMICAAAVWSRRRGRAPASA